LANGNGGLSRLNAIPWTPVITVVGWIALGILFYGTTKQQLAQQDRQINEILRSRERMISENTARLDRIQTELRGFEERVDRLDTPLARKVEGMVTTLNVVNDRINSLSNALNSNQVTASARLEQIQKQIDGIEKRADAFVQALDAQYNALNEHLRSHGTGGIPRR